VPAAASVSARTMTRAASSILKALSPDGFASVSAARAARSKAAGSGRAPASSSSADRARHGFAVFLRERNAGDPFRLLDELGRNLSRLLTLRGEGPLKGNCSHADTGKGGEELAAGEGLGVWHGMSSGHPL